MPDIAASRTQEGGGSRLPTQKPGVGVAPTPGLVPLTAASVVEAAAPCALTRRGRCRPESGNPLPHPKVRRPGTRTVPLRCERSARPPSARHRLRTDDAPGHRAPARAPRSPSRLPRDRDWRRRGRAGPTGWSPDWPRTPRVPSEGPQARSRTSPLLTSSSCCASAAASRPFTVAWNSSRERFRGSCSCASISATAPTATR